MVHYPAHLDADDDSGIVATDAADHDDDDDDDADQQDDYESLLVNASSNGTGSSSGAGAGRRTPRSMPSSSSTSTGRNNKSNTLVRGAICALSLALGLASGVGVRRVRSQGAQAAATAETLPPQLSHVHASWHPRARSLRFPSVQERVQLYMSNWYVPPCRRRSSSSGREGSESDGDGDDLDPRLRYEFLSGLIWYRWHYEYLSVLRERGTYDPNGTLIPDVTFEPPNHYAAVDRCVNVVVSGDVASQTDKNSEQHNLYVLDWYPVSDCSVTSRDPVTGVKNHHMPYCVDSLEMIAIMDRLEGRTVEQRGENEFEYADEFDEVDYGEGEDEVPLLVNGETGLEYADDDHIDEETGRRPTNMFNKRVPIIVRFGDTLGVLCDLPIFGKTRGAARTVTARARAQEEEEEESGGDDAADDDRNEGAHDGSRSRDGHVTDALKAVIAASAATRAAANGVDDDNSNVATSCYTSQLHIPRPALKTTDETYLSYSPIVWDFHSSRSNQMLRDILDQDTPWKDKKPVAMWRGALTGAREEFNRTSVSDEEVCSRMPRCRLVRNYIDSKSVDARLTHVVDVPMPDSLSRESGSGSFGGAGSRSKWRLFEDGGENQKMPYQDQLKAKALIVLEGNDLATGLRWSLLSRSVVLMPPPTRTSWAMEEWLQPWVHYIPLNSNLTNVEERVEWIIDNDEEAERIAERGTLFAYDLVLHPNAERDDSSVKEDMMRRYGEYFILTPELAQV